MKSLTDVQSVKECTLKETETLCPEKRKNVITITNIYPDDDDRDGHRNVGILRTPNAADSPRRLYQVITISFSLETQQLTVAITWQGIHNVSLKRNVKLL
jgi:hypothetical protein